MRLGVDLDGVVANFNRGWIERYNRDFGAALTEDQIVEWDAPVDLTHFDHMDLFWEWARTCGEGRSVFRWLDAYPGAVAAIQRLAGDGHEIVILTTKPDFAIDDTHDWLSDKGVPTTEVHILHDKSTVGCDFYIDDADHNVAALVAAHPRATVCRYVRPWNSPVAGAIDVGDWSDIERVCLAASQGSG